MNQPLRLHPVKRATKRSNRFCGPSALSILTGLDTKDTAALLRSVTGHTRITGTSASAMKDALAKLGYTMCSDGDHGCRTAYQRPTLAQWSRANPRRGSITFLLSVGNHWAVVQGRRYACGLVDKPVALKGCPKWRARVKAVWSIHRHDTSPKAAAVVAAIPVIAAKATFLSQTAARMAVKRLAEPYSIEVDDRARDKDDPDATIWVYPGDQWPTDLADPFNDEHYHYDWASARKAVETYVAAITAHRIERSLGAAEPVTFVTS